MFGIRILALWAFISCISMENQRDNAADVQAAQKREKDHELELLHNRNDLRSILELPGGVRFLRRLLNDCGIMTELTTNSAEIYRQAAKQGIGLRYAAEIKEVCRKHFPKKWVEIIAGSDFV